MKILTLNAHSLREERYPEKLRWFIEGSLQEKPDIIALQEVNQSVDAELMDPEALAGQYPMPGAIRIRSDNHAAQVAMGLRRAGVECWWAWLPIKVGYGKYDEGVAIISLGRKIRSVDQFSVCRKHDYTDWRSRGVLGVKVDGMDDWFYTVHMGWWEDEQAPFLEQLKILNCCLAAKRFYGPVWLLGAFNAPSDVPRESYDALMRCGWVDTYTVARERDDGITVPGAIEGWSRPLSRTQQAGMRLDYILCSHRPEVRSSRTVFNGIREKIVSDHYGVMIETEGANVL